MKEGGSILVRAEKTPIWLNICNTFGLEAVLVYSLLKWVLFILMCPSEVFFWVISIFFCLKFLNLPHCDIYACRLTASAIHLVSAPCPYTFWPCTLHFWTFSCTPVLLPQLSSLSWTRRPLLGTKRRYRFQNSALARFAVWCYFCFYFLSL